MVCVCVGVGFLRRDITMHDVCRNETYTMMGRAAAVRETLLSKKVHRMRLDPSFCEVQPARALYRGGVNNGGGAYEVLARDASEGFDPEECRMGAMAGMVGINAHQRTSTHFWLVS